MKSELAQAIADLDAYRIPNAGPDKFSDHIERSVLPALRATAKEMTRLVEENGVLRSLLDANFVQVSPGVWQSPGVQSVFKKPVPSFESIICAAVRIPDGYIVRGHRHDSAMRTAGDIPRYKDVLMTQEMQGFVTSHNRFVGREEAHRIHYGREGMLFSEDLY